MENLKEKVMFALACMEEFRTLRERSSEGDNAIRICQSYLMDVLGYETRVDAMNALKKEAYIPTTGE